MAERSAVEAVLKQRVLPLLQEHGGDLRLMEIGEDGTVTLELLGACAGCPSADLSTKGLIEDILREEFPEIRQVELFHPVSDELMDMARKILGASGAEQR